MHYYSFHIGDYIKQTVHLTPMEDICYRRLLDMYYETELPIPTETDRVSRRLRLDTELVDSVLREFFVLTERGWSNPRCDEEIRAYHVKVDAARANGKRGGRPKKTQSVLDRNPAKTGSKANQEPITKNQEPDKNNTPGKPDVFDPAAYLAEYGIEPGLIADWVELRKGKRAAVTQTALTRIKNEALKAKMPLAEVLAMCCERGWAGFQAEWVTKNQRGVSSGKQAAREQYLAEAAAAEQRLRGGEHGEHTERDITGECSVIF